MARPSKTGSRATAVPEDPNCHCFDPTRTLALNPAAWVDAPPGQFGASALYYNDSRWQRQPSEAFNFGRIFRIKDGAALSVRVEFQNIVNQVFLSAPVAHNNSGGALSAGYGFVNTLNGAGTQPRTGQLVARFTF